MSYFAASLSLCRRPLLDRALGEVPNFYVSQLIDLNERRWRVRRAG